MLTAEPAAGVLAMSSTADTSRLTWIITLAIVCAMFAVCVTIVVRGNRPDPHRTRRQTLRIKRARNSLWVLVALICLTIARIIVAPH